MVFVGHGSPEDIQTVPLATSHTLRLTAETSDISHKDVTSGKWAATEIDQFSWEATTDNLYCEAGIDMLYSIMENQELVNVYFGTKSQADGTPLPATGSWTQTADEGFCGQAYITSLEVNAPNGENATYSATFTGVGELASLVP